MDKLYLWFNPRTGQVYQKYCRDSQYKIGSYNQYGHLLFDILECFEDTIYSQLTFASKMRILTGKGNKRE